MSEIRVEGGIKTMSAAQEQEEKRDQGNDESRNLFADLKRRKVFRVITAYGVGAWLILQIVDVLSGAFPLPDSTLAATSIALAIGFPIAAALSWAFQVTPEGVVLDVENAGQLSKNRSRLIHFIDVIIICVLLVVVTYLSFGERFTTFANDEIRVAVLPFENLSNDEDVTYLSDGIADDIRTRLSEVPQLLIAARSSSLSLFGKGLDIKTIGARLTVEHVLEGTIRQAGNRIRVTTQLIDVETGFSRWSKIYNTRVDDVLEMQNNISLMVASELEILLSKEVRQTLAKNPTNDTAAYDLYLQAKNYLSRPRTRDSLDHATTLFRRSIERDPTFALGYAGLCQTYISRYYDTSDIGDVGNAETNCNRALSLDPGLSQVHTALGNLYSSMSRWDDAESSFRTAINIDPRDYDAFIGMGNVFVAQERYVEAEARYNASIEVLPANWLAYDQLAYFMLRQGRLEDAVVNYKRVVELSPDNVNAFNNLGVSYYMMGNFENAAENFRSSLELEPKRSAYSNTGTMYYLAGNFSEAIAMYQKATDEADSDYRLWGNLADAQRFVVDAKDEAQHSYRKAIDLALTQMTVSGSDPEVLTNLAWYHVNIGQKTISERYLESAIGMPNRSAEQLYTTALVYTMLGKPDLAEQAILDVRELGFSKEILDATPELQNPANQVR